MSKNTVLKLEEFGQSVWLDYISRSIIETGKLKSMIDIGLRGMTSNPSIFNKAVSGAQEYDGEIEKAYKSGKTILEIYDDLTVRDIRNAADIFKDVYEKTPIDSEPEDTLQGKIASVVCFLIAPAYRKKGVSRKLLNHAINMLKEKGYAWIEAYPRKGELSDAHSYHGPVSLFASEGFSVIKEDEHFLLMRKPLV